jgi:hypothetical protein
VPELVGQLLRRAWPLAGVLGETRHYQALELGRQSLTHAHGRQFRLRLGVHQNHL